MLDGIVTARVGVVVERREDEPQQRQHEKQPQHRDDQNQQQPGDRFHAVLRAREITR